MAWTHDGLFIWIYHYELMCISQLSYWLSILFNSWSANQVIGEPNVYPRYGDLTGTWASAGFVAEWIEVNSWNHNWIKYVTIIIEFVYSRQTKSIAWLLMSWWRRSQAKAAMILIMDTSKQAGPSCSLTDYECHFSEAWYEMQMHIHITVTS